MLKKVIKKTAITKVLSCFFVFVILMSVVPVSASTDQAEILEFKHTIGTVNPKSQGTALVAIENTGTTTRSFWVGLSYKKQGASECIDIKPQQSIDLEPSLSTNVQFSWTLTSEQGTYDIFTKIWNSYDTSTKKMIPPSYDEQIDEGAFTIASASHELDYDNIAKYMSNATTFYTGYTDNWFNPEYWHNIGQGTVSEGVSNSLHDFFDAPTDNMAEQFLLPKYLHSTTGAASIASAMINIGAGILGLFYGTVYNIMSYIIKTGSSYSDIINYLNALKANSKDIKSAAENRDVNTLNKQFIARKNILEDLYRKLPMYDSDVHTNLRTGMYVFQRIGVVGDTGYRAYRTVKPFIISLHLQLQMDYIFTSYQLNRMAGREGFEELNLVVNAPIRPTRFDNDPGCSVLIGCVDAIGGSNEFEIILGANDISSNKELHIELAYCPKTKDDLDGITMYAKYGEKPTTSSYDEKGRYITIENPKQGSYYILLKAENVPGMYKLVAQVYKPNWLRIPICKSVTIYSKGFVFEQYPQPEVVDIRVDKSEISLNEWVTLTVKVTNKGGNASWQSIAISSPNVTSVDSYEILSHNMDYFEKYDIGYEAGFNYGTGTTVLEYPLIEGGKYNWTKRFNGEVKLKIKPNHVGDLRLYVKSVAFGEGVWQPNPEIFGSPTKDQQDEYVHVKEVTVIADGETTLPNEIADKKPLSEPFTSTNTIGMDFVLIPAGEFDMGSPSDEAGRYSDERPVHHVEIENPFYMGKYEVTEEQWREIMGDNPSDFTGYDDLPVEWVSWDDVQEFIKKLNEKEGTTKYRLPSEAEWEYACRAGTTTRYSFGDDESELGDYAWYWWGNSGSQTHPVGQKKANPWGLYDMHGNVWEWVQDCWHDSYSGAPADGSAWVVACTYGGAGRVARGGSWSRNPRDCRSASRDYGVLGYRFSSLGFRLLREV